jgi:hypothetical protein
MDLSRLLTKYLDQGERANRPKFCNFTANNILKIRIFSIHQTEQFKFTPPLCSRFQFHHRHYLALLFRATAIVGKQSLAVAVSASPNCSTQDARILAVSIAK